ncbi:hypothetical protein C482_11086 [Natrialba chahannaoensis JCM 10990]|uniref:DUF7961 domain-containing protein n=1 Tax=Natrialba chahannaoensis JCM 10990 TaxID=1227492 RepID=M0AK83_9EURY|nr:hypothetical protein [Natrialba chahannaoensis]ELY99095.1 hypothetical protein C482_11086 [Natrialba chahannaoensis JCM 10990]
MSTTSSADHPTTIDCCRPADVSPVSVEASALESTAPGHLRDLKREFAAEGFSPVELTVEACFDEDCSLATQDEINRVRDYVRAASFLGAGTVTVAIDDVANPEKVRPALAACAERAEREGLVFDLDHENGSEGSFTLDD